MISETRSKGLWLSLDGREDTELFENFKSSHNELLFYINPSPN